MTITLPNPEDLKAIDMNIKDNVLEGKVTLRDMVELQSNALQLFPDYASNFLGMDKNIAQVSKDKTKKFHVIIDSMTEEEIAHPELLQKHSSRIERIRRGAGCQAEDVRDLLAQYKLIKRVTQNLPKRGMGGHGTAQRLANMLPPQIRQQLGIGNAAQLNNWLRRANK